MNRLKRIAWMLSVLLMTSLLMSCTGANTQSETENATNATEAPTETETETEPLIEARHPYDDAKTFDLKGKEIKVLVLGGNGKPYPNPDDDSYEETLERIEFVEAKYNCKLVFVTDYGYPEIHDQIVASVMGGINIADIMYCLPWDTAVPYISQNIAIPLNDYLDFSNENLAWNELNNWGKYDDQNYILATSSTGVNCCLLYNKDIVEAMNLEDPFELQQKGEWTWDKFLELCEKAVRRDADGKVTQWGVVTASGADFIMQLLASNNAEVLKYENGGFNCDFSDPKVMEVFEFLNEIVVQKQCGILTELLLEVPERGDKAWKQGKSLFAFCSFSEAKVYSPANCGILICPKGPSATEYAAASHSGPAYMVSSLSKEPEASARIMYDLFARWDRSMPGCMDDDEYDAFMTGSNDYTHVFCENDFETLKLFRTNQSTASGRFVLFNDIQNYMLNCIYAPNVYLNCPLSTQIDEWQPVANQFLDEVNTAMKNRKGLKE